MDDRVEAAIKETENESDFYYWLHAVIRIESNRIRDTPENRIDVEATYRIEAGTYNNTPGYEMKLVIAEGGASGTDYSGADVDVDWLSVHAEEIKRIPSLGEQVVEYVRT